MARFTLPRDLYHGKGSIAELANLKGKKAIVVVGGGSMKRFGFLDKVEGYLKQAGMEVRLFENVEPDPSVETVMRGAAAMREFEPDWIVAMGGGSPIDAAKAMWAFYEYPEVTFEDLITRSASRRCARRRSSAPFRPRPALPPRSPLSLLLPTMRRVSSILWRTSTSHRISPLWTRTWPRRCPRS